MPDKWLQIKGDPSVRAFLFQQSRVESLFDHEIDRIHDIVFKLGKEGLQQGRLARTDFARDDDEAVREPDRRLHVGLGPGVLLAPIEKLRVRR